MIIKDELLPWHSEAWHSINNYRLKGRIPQALLVSGSKGLGKLQFAERFAVFLICQAPSQEGIPCGRCQSCHLIEADTHPDLMHLKPEAPGKIIPIDSIRNIIAKLMLKPQYDSWRVLIIEAAEQLNTAAANAFLKFLEEPSERTVILLISSRPFRLPATIRSRCQSIKLSAPSKTKAVEWLKSQRVDADLIKLLGIAQGSPLLAMEYISNLEIERRDKCLADWIGIARQRSHPVTVAEDWNSSTPDNLLTWLISWIADLIKWRHQSPIQYLTNPEVVEFLQDRAQRLDLKKIFVLYDLLLTDLEKFDTQLNKQLMFEEILVLWAQINR